MNNDNHNLSERQRREREFYNRVDERKKISEVDFEPVIEKERRPWNSYWSVYDMVMERFDNSGQKLLDFGCGAGITSLRFAKVGYTVYGFDISDSRIETCKELAKKYQLDERTYFSVLSSENLNYEDDFFDIVVGFDILHHVEIEQSIRELKRVLKPDGLLIFKEPIEVNFLDTIRKTSLMRKIVPNNSSIENEITEDEKKLTEEDLKTVLKHFPKIIELKRFHFSGRINRFLPEKLKIGIRYLEQFDLFLFSICPPLKKMGGSIVFCLKK